MTTPCRNCYSSADRPVFCDLGYQPLSNQYLREDELEDAEVYFPLVPTICRSCGLIQLPELANPEQIFTRDYAYHSSQSSMWVQHVSQYARKMIGELGLTDYSSVIEVASNDGAMLREFRLRNVPAFGVEPAQNLAAVAQFNGLATIPEFMGRDLAQSLIDQGYQGADLIAANNVMAHVPDLDDFLGGILMLLKPRGTFTVEFPDAQNIVTFNQFDTIYHEHYSYFTLATAMDTLRRREFMVTDYEFLETHGGSIRMYAVRPPKGSPPNFYESSPPLADLFLYADNPATYRRKLLKILLRYQDEGRRVVGYGAPAKGNTMLNYIGADRTLVDYVVDSTPDKQGKFLPGSRIPVFGPEVIDTDKPDVVMVLAWNWIDEILPKLAEHKARGGKVLCGLEEV